MNNALLTSFIEEQKMLYTGCLSYNFRKPSAAALNSLADCACPWAVVWLPCSTCHTCTLLLLINYLDDNVYSNFVGYLEVAYFAIRFFVLLGKYLCVTRLQQQHKPYLQLCRVGS